MRYLATFILAGSLAAAQATEDRTFRVHSAATDQDFQDLATAAVVASGLKAKSADATLRELSISGPVEQIRIASWVLAELDRPAPATPPPPSAPLTLQTKEPDNTIRVFYPSKITSDQDFAEVVNAILTSSDIRYVARYASHRAIVLRASPEQLALAEWLLAELNRDSPQQTYAFPKSGVPEYHVRVFRFARAKDAQQFNEAQTMIRTLTETRWLYPNVSRRAVVVRGSEEQIDMTRWILAQVDKELPAAKPANSADYTTKAGEVMRMFYFSGSMPSQTFLQLQTAIRMGTGIRFAYPFASALTLAVRGTPVQIAQAEALAAQ